MPLRNYTTKVYYHIQHILVNRISEQFITGHSSVNRLTDLRHLRMM